MFERNHRIYYESRAAHATGLGDRAADPTIAALHYELALRYSILSLRATEARPDVVAIGNARRFAPREREIETFSGSVEHEIEQALKQA